jgi:aryl-alcohol dehydrogenase-like predicted oxidoreductase
MKYRKHRGLSVSEVGVGCYALSGVYGAKDVNAFKQMLRHAFDLGVNFFDTAEAYGDAERVLGEVVHPYRDEVVIATKVGIREGLTPNLSKEYVHAACSRSLEQLHLDYIDLYQVHFDDPSTPVEETVEALEELVRGGKIRYYGVGHLPVDRIETYCRVGKPFSVLMELNAAARSARDQLLPLCRKHKLGAIAFSTTGRGLLTGKIRPGTVFPSGDLRRMDPMFQRERFQSGLRIAEKLAALGKEQSKTPAQVAIAWVLVQQGIISALTGPSNISHLEENTGASGWTLPSSALAALERFLAEEEKQMQNKQQVSLRRILTVPLPQNPSQALSDLVYVIETAVELGKLGENDVMPILRDLLPLRANLAKSSLGKLEAIRMQLAQLVGLKTS